MKRMNVDTQPVTKGELSEILEKTLSKVLDSKLDGRFKTFDKSINSTIDARLDTFGKKLTIDITTAVRDEFDSKLNATKNELKADINVVRVEMMELLEDQTQVLTQAISDTVIVPLQQKDAELEQQLLEKWKAKRHK